MTQSEILRQAIESGMIDILSLERAIEENKIMKHGHKIWQGSNGRWLTYVTCDTKRKLISKSTKEELNTYLAEFYNDLENNPTVDSCFKAWTEKKLEYGEIEPQTVDRYRSAYSRLAQEPMGNTKIGTITDTWLEDVIKRIIKENRLNYKAYSNLRTVIIGTWKYAYKKGWTSLRIAEFFSDIDLPRKLFNEKPKNDAKEVFTEEEAKEIIAYITRKTATKTELGVLLALQTGLRCGEIAVLTKKDYDRNSRTLSVDKTMVHHKGEEGTEYSVRNSTKGKEGHRVVYLSDSACKTIEVLINLSPKDNLFDVKSGAFTNQLYRICDKLGIRKRSLHKCRKTYATNLVNNGVQPILVAKMLGHTKDSTTIKHYYYDNYSKEKEKQIITSASL